MKSIFLLISISFSVNSVSAQTWKEMMNNPNVNIYDVVQEAESYFENIDIHEKGSGWKTYQRWLFENEPKFYPSGDRSEVDPYFVSKNYEAFLLNNPSPKALFNTGWEELGPHYIEQVTGHYAVGLGRVETFYADPNDADRIYLGSRSGGFWKTTDGGTTWTESTTDFLFASGVNTMTVSPTNPDSVFINVRNSRNGTTHGVYLSTDAGDTWNVTNFNPTNLGWGGMGTNRQIYQVIYHPTVPGLMFVGTNEGLFRSTDNLNTWTNPIATLDFQTIAFHPTNPSIIYAKTSNNNSAIYVSTDGGISFNLSNTIPGNSSSIKLSTTPACPTCVYIGSSDGVWKSSDEGMNFAFVSDPGISNFGAFAVSDIDTNIILFGDIDTHMSYDEGVTFGQVTYWSQGNANYNTTGTYVHADIRGSRCQNGVFWVNTDGLLCKSLDNGATWIMYEGQSIRENYNLGLSQSNHERTITGSQDNGTSIKTENSWVEFYGADGMEGIIHPLNDDWMIGSLQNGGRRRTKDGGQTQSGITPSGQTGYWIAPLFYDPNDQMTVYHMGDSIYRSNDFGSSWMTVGSPNFSGTIQYATIAENNSNILVATRGANIEISLDGGVSFTSIQSGLPNSSIRDVVFDPKNDSTIVVIYASYQNNGQKVYMTNDQGSSWQNITYNLGDMPIRSVVIDHTNASTIYLGCEIGVFKKAMNAATWSLYNVDLPNTSILELEVMNGSNTLRAATWGRGLWEFTLDGRQSYPSILTTQITDQPTDEFPLEGDDQFVTSVISYDNTITSAYVEWSINSPVFGNVIPMTNTIDSTWVSNLPIPNQVAGTKVFFKVFAVGNAGDTTETYKFMYEVKPEVACLSSGNMGWATAVTLVDFNTIFNSTGKTQPYTDYSPSDSATVVIGSSHDLSVNVNTDGNYSVHARVWIDWNDDADFADPGEQYELGSAQNTPDGPTDLSPLTITVPLTAQIGKTTMRVSAKFGSPADSCDTDFDGEVEDYAIIIEKMLLVDSTGFSICSNDSVYVGGAWQTSAGVYYDTIAVSPIADSVQITSLGVNSISSSTDIQTECESYTWPSNGATYTTSGVYTATLVNAAGCDSIITLDLTINASSTTSETIEVCDNYTWPVNGLTYSATGTYSEILTNANGCDSVLTLNLTINSASSSVSQLGEVLTADLSGASYQWINCPSMTPINGATNQSYTATVNGDYAVIVTINGCSDTSSCFTVGNIGILENDFGTGLSIYPNPTSGKFSIDLGEVYESGSVRITDISGKLVHASDFSNRQLLEFVLKEAAGVYLLIIESKGQKAAVRLVKE
ncbi:MAG: GEVED domain-containing protein [Crocinitomicaceae bacterium]